ncbi:DUF6507 family protein [Nocardiopsis sp. N85]|uniref:DUF6507 family protein n=1 Tax=Nocardiopsis sp. N85 TaxID=3029400 RepID=UPI00237FA209|nr:DUF6507 family protein [Nocardiopsis sp. N85]MDE3719944.1 DUF6507 family protein [Nocardiopsis sp. N85]
MSSWDIDPARVGGVLEATLGHLGDEEGTGGLTRELSQLETHLGNAVEECGSGIVSDALGRFAEHYFGVLGDMAGTTLRAVEGAYEATTHYMEGNLEMAAEAQANAAKEPATEATPSAGSGHQPLYH